jgi:hypothetical protein
MPEAKCAKRTRFASDRVRHQRRKAQNEPNLVHFTLQTPRPPPSRAGLRAKRTQFGPPEGGRQRRIVQNEPNFAPAQAADGWNCAKRSQTWGSWGIWEKAVVLWPYPGGRVNAQNKPNRARCRAGTLKPFDYRSGRALRRARRTLWVGRASPLAPRSHPAPRDVAAHGQDRPGGVTCRWVACRWRSPAGGTRT